MDVHPTKNVSIGIDPYPNEPRVILVAGLLFRLAILHHADEEVGVSILSRSPQKSDLDND